MAKRISSLFSTKDETGGQWNAETQDTYKAPPQNKLSKPRSNLYLNMNTTIDLEPPPLVTPVGTIPRPSSRDGRQANRISLPGSRNSSGSRPQTPSTLGVPLTASPARDQSPASAKLNKRRSWLPGKADRNSIMSPSDPDQSPAWVAGLVTKPAYDVTPLLTGQPVSDLWNNYGDVLVYLYPQESGKGPCFRLPSELFKDSRTLSYLAEPVRSNGRQQIPSLSLQPVDFHFDLSLSGSHQPPQPDVTEQLAEDLSNLNTQPQEPKHLYLPLGLEGDVLTPGSVPVGDDFELVILYRNFFAFLIGGPLVCTTRQNTIYAVFMGISSILKRLQYGNEKDSSWGVVPWTSFLKYTDELNLADVRYSREKVIEMLLVGQAMRSWPLYTESFTHAVGRLDEIRSINSPKFSRLDRATVNRLDRARMDLEQRLLVMRSKLDNFYFPSMFAGIANSQTATEGKLVRFKAWKASFMDFRTHTIAVYKKKYGSWPPKASSKKNNFEESGINRLLLREVYQDFIDLYEMLVDRTSITTRTRDLPMLADDAESGSNETIQHALRSVESEYDRSVPPVLPAIPFDVPLIPSFGSSLRREHIVEKDPQHNTRLKDSALSDLLLGASNKESIKSSSWIQAFIEFERKAGHGKTLRELIDLRCGQWLFMYAVLQAMPMTVVDARDLQHIEGVEHFLCEAPRGGRPWMREDKATSRSWFNVASGGGLVSLPADMIDHSVEGTYRRSYLWQIANTWAEQLGPMSPVEMMPPQFFGSSQPGSPHISASGGSAATSPFNSPLLRPIRPYTEDSDLGLPRVSSRTSMHLGLQEVAAESVPAPRPVSTYNPNLTFDSILTPEQLRKSGKKSKR